MRISAILTCHREGLLLGPSLASFGDSIGFARRTGLSVEALIVIDRADELTKDVAATFRDTDLKILATDFGDPGQARNAGVAAASGDFVSFLDGDDLWSFNWLTEALQFSCQQATKIVCHSEVNVVFGGARQIWWHADSLNPGFQSDYMHIGNYWDAMSFTSRDILQVFPFKKNSLAEGFGHEDWHWNSVTLGSGIPHRPVPDTVHFKRRRKHSQMAKCAELDVMTFPTGLSRFAWVPG